MHDKTPNAIAVQYRRRQQRQGFGVPEAYLAIVMTGDDKGGAACDGVAA
jgi:hypothetical protein